MHFVPIPFCQKKTLSLSECFIRLTEERIYDRISPDLAEDGVPRLLFRILFLSSTHRFSFGVSSGDWMAMAQHRHVLFIFECILILCAWDHCPSGRSKYDRVLATSAGTAWAPYCQVNVYESIIYYIIYIMQYYSFSHPSHFCYTSVLFTYCTVSDLHPIHTTVTFLYCLIMAVSNFAQCC